MRRSNWKANLGIIGLSLGFLDLTLQLCHLCKASSCLREASSRWWAALSTASIAAASALCFACKLVRTERALVAAALVGRAAPRSCQAICNVAAASTVLGSGPP